MSTYFKKLIAVSICTVLMGCGGSGDSSDSNTDGGQPPIPEEEVHTGSVKMKGINISRYTAIGKAPNISRSIGITEDGTTEEIAPEWGIETPEGEIIPPVACTLALPQFQINTINELGNGWNVIQATVSTDLNNCEFENVGVRYYFQSPINELFEISKDINMEPQKAISGSHGESDHFMIVKANSVYNQSSEPLLYLKSWENPERNGIYQMIIKNGEPQLQFVVPANDLSDWDKNNWAYKNGDNIYYTMRYDNVLRKTNTTTGVVETTWNTGTLDGSAAIPFPYNGKLYVPLYGNHFVELPQNGGTINDSLPKLDLPANTDNNWGVSDVVDDRFIIGNRCTVWDMEQWISYTVQDTGGHANISVNGSNLFCVGNDYKMGSSNSISGSSFNFDTSEMYTHTPTQTKLAVESSRLENNFMVYETDENNVFETDTITVDLTNGNKTVQTHYYDGEKLIDLIPVVGYK